MAPKRILFVVIGEPGHLHPMIAVAQHLSRSGAQLAFHCQQDLSARLARAGLSALLFGAGGASPQAVDSERFGRRLSDPRWLQRYLQMVLIDRVGALVSGVREAIRQFDPHVVCVDAMAYEGALAATLEQRPWVGISTNLIPVVPSGWRFEYLDVFEALAPARRALCSEAGAELSFHGSDTVSPWLNLAFAVEELVPPGERYAFLVGPALPLEDRGDEPEFPWNRLPGDRPLIYIAFGTQVAHTLDFTRELLASFSPEEAHLVVAMKDQLARLPTPLPSHVTAVAYAPQLRLLERASVMINHGGANSVMECLYQGKPQLVLPLAYDQFIQARIIEESGAGAAAYPECRSAASCREQVLSMLAPGSSYRRAAERVGAAMRRRHGGAEASALILGLAEEPRAMRPRAGAALPLDEP